MAQRVIAWIDAIARFPLFADAEAATVEAILAHSDIEERARHEVIVCAGDPLASVYLVLEGACRAFVREESGLELATEIIHAPGRFGDLEAIAGFVEHRTSIEAISPVVLARVPIAVIDARLELDHALCLAWLYGVARDHGASIDADRQCVLGDLAARTAHVLLAHGGPTGEHVARSYAELASDVGCSRRSAITVMQSLEKRGAVEGAANGWRLERSRLAEALIPVHSAGDDA